MAPGLALSVGGRPTPKPILKLFSFLYPKADLAAEVHVNGEMVHHTHYLPTDEDKTPCPPEAAVADTQVDIGDNALILEDLAYARSGDKGNSANIGVIARHPSFVPYLRKYLTTDAVYDYFEHLFDDKTPDSVQRFELPGINGFNFFLKNSLGGGGVSSLRTDPQGKYYAQMLLDIEISNLPDSVVDMAKGKEAVDLKMYIPDIDQIY